MSAQLVPQQRADAIAAVNAVAVKFRWAVARKDGVVVQQVVHDLVAKAEELQLDPVEVLAALAIVLAEAVTDGMGLVAITRQPDDGLPSPITEKSNVV